MPHSNFINEGGHFRRDALVRGALNSVDASNIVFATRRAVGKTVYTTRIAILDKGSTLKAFHAAAKAACKKPEPFYRKFVKVKV